MPGLLPLWVISGHSAVFSRNPRNQSHHEGHEAHEEILINFFTSLRGLRALRGKFVAGPGERLSYVGAAYITWQNFQRLDTRSRDDGYPFPPAPSRAISSQKPGNDLATASARWISIPSTRKPRIAKAMAIR